MPSPVAEVRAFNRFYTATIGVLQEGLLRTPYSLTEARVLFELAQLTDTEVAELRRTLGLDAGYVSRMLARFESDGLVRRTQSATDGRRQVIRLTEAGRAAQRRLDERSAQEIERLLDPLGAAQRRRLLDAMATIRGLLTPSRTAEVTLRGPRPGDYGWVVARHGALYAEEYGWDASFEALVARIVADFAGGYDPAREHGSPRSTGSGPAACSAYAATTPRPSCACCSSSRTRAAWASAPGWWASASSSRAPPGTARWFCGPTTCSPRPAGSTSAPASSWSPRIRTTATARTWSARTGPSTSDRPGRPVRRPAAPCARMGAMTEGQETDERRTVVVVGPDGQPVGTVQVPTDEAEAGEREDPGGLVEQPAKVMRIGSMIKQLLEEVRAAPLDEAGRQRLTEIHRRSITELEDGLAPELREELERLSLPFDPGHTPSEAELRIAQAQLVGWLEGLFHGIQAALVAQQMAARLQLEQMRGGPRPALPPGLTGLAPGQVLPPGQPGDGTNRTGQYL
jgi:DNA-binding MarR family transcriptional regulator